MSFLLCPVFLFNKIEDPEGETGSAWFGGRVRRG
jgi:hypothetical protein